MVRPTGRRRFSTPTEGARLRDARQPRNGGKGAALRRGFAAVTPANDHHPDAILEYSPEEYKK